MAYEGGVTRGCGVAESEMGQLLLHNVVIMIIIITITIIIRIMIIIIIIIIT